MTRKIWTLMAMTLLLAAWAVSGCSKSTTSPSGSTTTENQNLNDPTGGYNTQGEQPGFGDQTLVGSGSAEATTTDPLETTDPQVNAWAALPDSVHAYSVTLLWGVLRKDPAIRLQNGDPAQGVFTNWDGSASANQGALVLRSTIAFDSYDHIIRPRPDRRTISWVSRTSDSFDGVRFWVYQPFPNGSDGSGDTLTVVAGAHRWTFPVNSLSDTDTTYVVDQAGNRFAIQAFRVQPGSCLRGFLNGVWLLPTSSNGNGFVRGRVLGNRGEVVGDMKGFFGKNAQGATVFFAKYINAQGTFEGIIRGTWTDDGTEVAESGGASVTGRTGTFAGEVLDVNKSPVGAVRGRWHARPDGSDGFFEGLWSVGCTN